MTADLRAVLDDLRARRAMLDGAIAAFEKLSALDGAPMARAAVKGSATVKRSQLACPECGKLCAPTGLGPHRAKAHGAKKKDPERYVSQPERVLTPRDLAPPSPSGKERRRIKMMQCPQCGAYTTLDPCERCHIAIPGSVAA